MLEAERASRLRELVVESLGGARQAADGYRLSTASGLHLTLFFLGDVARTELKTVCQGATANLDQVRALLLSLDRTGAFPARGHERVLWAGVRELPGGEGRLLELKGRVRAGVPGHGAKPDARAEFRPHVTVARPKGRRPAAVPVSFYELVPAKLGVPAWRPEAVALVESVRGQGPAEYRTLERWALEAAPASSGAAQRPPAQ